MPKIRIEGTLSAPGFEVVRELVRDWIGAPTVKVRTIGEELVYRDDAVYLYIQSAVSSEGPLETFLVEGRHSGDLEGGRAWLQELPALCARHGIACDLGGTPLDDAGRPAGAEFEIAT